MKSSKSTLLPTFSAWESPYLPLIYRFILYAPGLWFMLFCFFVLAVTLQVGHLPAYGLPDPKNTGLLTFFYGPIILLLIWIVGTTPVGAVLTLIRLGKGFPKAVRGRETVFYLAGLGLFYLLVCNDVAGLMTWLAD